MDDFRGSAPARTTEALALREAQQLHGSIYLLGYAVECWTKAYMLKQGIPWQNSGTDPATGKNRSHNLVYLLTRSGLGPAIYTDPDANKFIVTAWSVHMRYHANDFAGMEREAKDLFRAGLKVALAIKRKAI